MYARRVLPEFLALLAERAARSSAAIGGSTIKALLDSAAATAGIVATAPGTTADEAWDDAWLLQSGLYDRLLGARRARFGPTPNRVPHRGYTPDEVRVAAETLLAADAAAEHTGREAGMRVTPRGGATRARTHSAVHEGDGAPL